MHVARTRAAAAAAKRMNHHVPCTAPICSPLAAAAAAAASGAAQFILRVRAGYVRYIRVLRKSVPPGRSIPHVRGIEPRLLSRPRFCAHCAHVNGHIDTGVWRSYRERACPAPHRAADRPPPTGASLLPSPSSTLPHPPSPSLSPSCSASFFSLSVIRHLSRRALSRNDDISLPLAPLSLSNPFLSFSLLSLSLSLPPSPRLVRYDFCDT